MTMCADGYCDRPSQVHHIVSDAFYGMHSHWINRRKQQNSLEAPPPAWAAQVRSMALYDSMAFFMRGPPIRSLHRIIKGTDRIPYGAGDHQTRSIRRA